MGKNGCSDVAQQIGVTRYEMTPIIGQIEARGKTETGAIATIRHWAGKVTVRPTPPSM